MGDFLIAVNDMMLESALLSIVGCFIWGIISTLLSPCHLASIPLLISYMANQNTSLNTRQGGILALFFSLGLFVAIFTIGGICALVGKMLGDVPDWLYMVAGAILVWTGIKRTKMLCNLPSPKVRKWHLHGYLGGFFLGVIYGMVSGVCTFGFLAPMFSAFTEQKRIFIGILMIMAFALGHCTPIIAAGCGFGRLQITKLGGKKGSRQISSIIIIGIGIYFLCKPFF